MPRPSWVVSVRGTAHQAAGSMFVPVLVSGPARAPAGEEVASRPQQAWGLLFGCGY